MLVTSTCVYLVLLYISVDICLCTYIHNMYVCVLIDTTVDCCVSIVL